MWKRVAAIVASLVVSGFFLWLALRGVELQEVGGALRRASPGYSALALLVAVVGIFTRGLRWRGLVGDRVTVPRAFYIVGVMQLMNLLPLRLGEVARAALAAREEVPVATTASSILVERLLDLAFVLALLGVVTPQVEELPASVGASVRLFGVLAAVGTVGLVGLARFPGVVRGVLARLTGWFPVLERLPLEDLLTNALDGLKPLTDLRQFARAVWWTLVSWALSYGVFYFGGLALGVDASDVFFPALGLGLAAFAVALPVTVGAVGPFQGAVIVSGAAFGVPSVRATAVGFLVHGLTMASYAICGFWGAGALGASLGSLASSDEPETAASGSGSQGF